MSLIHVAIDARVPIGIAGGVAQVLVGMAQGFQEIDGGVRRTWVVYPDFETWLSEHIPVADDVLVRQTTFERYSLMVARRWPSAASVLRPHVEALLRKRTGEALGALNEELLRRRVDVVHLPFQDGFATSIPYVYHPHDLQHIHLPELFTEAQILKRDSVWKSRALGAAAVSVGTKHVAKDVIKHWGVPEGIVHVVPLAPVSRSNAGLGKEHVPGHAPLILYPAAFWAHKDHLTLARAAVILRNLGMDFRLVMPGNHNGTYSEVRVLLSQNGFDAAACLPGYVSDEDLSALFDEASVVCVPSRYESASFPIWEAFARGVPVVTSDAGALPSQAGKGGLVFPAGDPQACADALGRVLLDAGIRSELSAGGAQMILSLTWAQTVADHLDIYRHIVLGDPIPSSPDRLDF